MRIVTITQIAGLVGGILFIYFGFDYRKRDPKKNWLLFVAAGVAFILFSLLVLFGAINLE
jgi:hypothetical protein